MSDEIYFYYELNAIKILYKIFKIQENIEILTFFANLLQNLTIKLHSGLILLRILKVFDLLGEQILSLT